MFIQGALAHVNGTISTGDFLRFLSAHVPTGHYFMVEPPPGIIMTAAIDWRVILQDVASVSSFASALWSGYESYIKPLHDKDPRSAAGIFIQIKNGKGEFDQFVIDKDTKDREALIQRMEESAKILCPKSMAGALKQAMEETKKTDYWVMITEPLN